MIEAQRLIDLEQKYGGIIRGVPRNKVSPLDPRLPNRLPTMGMKGGDRMQFHSYAQHYARELASVAGNVTIVELGILTGIGLAMWCDLFPRSRVIGLDIDTDHFCKNIPDLERRGAFKGNPPEFYEFDELAADNAATIAGILLGDKIDILIDDALHDDDSILKAMSDFLPFMAPRFLYFVEDNKHVHKKIARDYSKLRVRPYGELTVIAP